ncbi:transposase [Niabella sp. CJ426]|uniref:transposase n=1 Tax=Niabella sp. CJ426 TaxID=3393740 RepID=UPI003D02C420
MESNIYLPSYPPSPKNDFAKLEPCSSGIAITGGVARGFDLSQKLSSIYRYCTCKEQAFKKLALWYNDVEASAIESFRTVSRTIETHYLGILNFFNNRSTNASAESFNAKIKVFNASVRGVRDINCFLFRLAKIYA